MDLGKNIFAKPLPKKVKFITALRITSRRYINGKFNAPAILWALLDDDKEDLTTYQKNSFSHVTLGEDKRHEVRKFFIDTYNNEDSLLDYLNEVITDKYFKISKYRKKEKTISRKEEEIEMIKEIINDSASDLIKDLF